MTNQQALDHVISYARAWADRLRLCRMFDEANKADEAIEQVRKHNMWYEFQAVKRTITEEVL